LTAREREVAELVAQGRTNKAIGEQLFISESTVKVHVRHILRKLNAEKRAEIAARIAGSQNS
jgi:DNA-binding NarL/FixJ family response regulator